MPPKDSIANTLLVSVVLCTVCSLLVSGAAVALKPFQDYNKRIDRQRNIIAACGLVEDAAELSSKEVEELYKSRITPMLVDLSTGDYVADPDPNFEPRKAAKDADQNVDITGQFSIGLSKREPKTWVYLVGPARSADEIKAAEEEAGEGNLPVFAPPAADDVEQVVFPIYGMGLWSTLYGYIAVDQDLRTVKGLTYYEHAETPGLGGEVENKTWKAKWIGKKIWEEDAAAEDENLKIGVVKGSPTGEQQKYMVDGLSGATITSRGVDSMLKYWFSDEGFGPFIKNLASKKGNADGEANS